jgi:hypothetical protein
MKVLLLSACAAQSHVHCSQRLAPLYREALLAVAGVQNSQ